MLSEGKQAQYTAPVCGAERRTEPRFTASDFSKIIASESGAPYWANVMDVSRSGLRLRTSAMLAPQTAVTLYMRDMSLEGRVCYCAPNEEGSFDVGVLIVDLKNPC